MFVFQLDQNIERSSNILSSSEIYFYKTPALLRFITTHTYTTFTAICTKPK